MPGVGPIRRPSHSPATAATVHQATAKITGVFVSASARARERHHPSAVAAPANSSTDARRKSTNLTRPGPPGRR